MQYRPEQKFDRFTAVSPSRSGSQMGVRERISGERGRKANPTRKKGLHCVAQLHCMADKLTSSPTRGHKVGFHAS